MNISIIIVSFNRTTYLENTIGYCFNQDNQPLEIIVIDASEEKLRLKDDFINSFGEKLKYVRWDEVGNISKQRNAGIKIAKGDIILFLDDDVEFEKNLLTNIVENFNFRQADGLSGLIESAHRKTSKEVHVFKKETLLYLGQPSFHQCDFFVETYLISAACFAVKKSALLGIGGFDEQQKGVFDDSDVGIRLTNAGYKIYHDNEIKVFHFAAKNSGSRSPMLGPVWFYSNVSYLQLKHFYKNNHDLFFKKAMGYFFRPSRMYLHPIKMIKTISDFKKGFAIAKLRIEQGPLYIDNSN